MPFLFSMLSKLLASMLVAVLAGATITVVLNQTVLNSHYIEGRLAATNGYNRLSDELVKQIGSQAANTGNLQLSAQLSSIITPTILQEKINSSLDQLQAYYRGNGPQPVIDLTDVAAQAQAAGIPIPENSGLTKPIVLSSNKQAQGLSKTFNSVRLGTILTAVVLTLALLAVSWERHKWAVLPDVLITVGVLIGLLAVAFAAASSLAGHYIKFNTDANAFALIGRDLASSIATDLARRLGIIAGVFAAVGIGTRIWVGTLRPKAPVKPATPSQLKQVQSRSGTLV